tara:strand:+ start:7903 stop:8607 length:705 start_codon:yes stop_codon:yes gene_type:complete
MRESHKKLLQICANFANDSYTQITVNSNENIDQINEHTTDTIVYIITSEDTVYITGPGSQSATDWSLDFQIWRTPVDYFDNSLVHTGFMKIYESIKIKLHQKLVAIFSLKNIKNIVCTGHSLFGAVSTIIACDCTNKYDSKKITCVTFGSPRVGNNEFARYFNTHIDYSYRCVFAKDPITFSPLPIRFKHVRGSISCDEKSARVVDTAELSKWNCCGCQIAHHKMNSYMQSFDN